MYTGEVIFDELISVGINHVVSSCRGITRARRSMIDLDYNKVPTIAVVIYQ